MHIHVNAYIYTHIHIDTCIYTVHIYLHVQYIYIHTHTYTIIYCLTNNGSHLFLLTNFLKGPAGEAADPGDMGSKRRNSGSI